MTAIDLDAGSFQGHDELFGRDGIAWAFSRVDDFTADLTDDLREYVCDVAEIRAKEFSSGRRAGREALSILKCSSPVIGRSGRRPTWPPGFVGSIGHTRELAVACCTATELYRGIGCDIERCDRPMRDGVAAKVMGEQEAKMVEHFDEGRTLVFAAKEAIYKAVNPVTDEFFNFHDVVLGLDLESRAFTAKCVGDRRSAPTIDSGLGWFATYRQHWVALFLIAN